MTSLEFLNVDLEIHSRSSLEPLLSELGERVCVLHSESQPNKHFASLEISRYWKNPSPDKTIAALCNVLESLSPKARAIWKKARSKVFDIGFNIDPKASNLGVSISHQSLRRIADLRGAIFLTCYNPSNFPKPPKLSEPVKPKIIKRQEKHPVGDIGREWQRRPSQSLAVTRFAADIPKID